jgi:hypothetical protein
MKLPTPNDRTAVAAGTWSGLVLWGWMIYASIVPTRSDQRLLFLIVATLILVPSFVLVFGARNLWPLSSKALLIGNPIEPGVVRRIFLWFLFTGAAWMIPFLVLTLVAGAT